MTLNLTIFARKLTISTQKLPVVSWSLLLGRIRKIFWTMTWLSLLFFQNREEHMKRDGRILLVMERRSWIRAAMTEISFGEIFSWNWMLFLGNGYIPHSNGRVSLKSKRDQRANPVYSTTKTTRLFNSHIFSRKQIIFSIIKNASVSNKKKR